MPDITMPALGDRTLWSVTEPWLITGVLVVAAVVATVVVLPGCGYGGVAVVAMALAAAMIVVGIMLHRPRRAVPWSLLAIGCLVHTTSTAVLAIRTQGGTTGGPGLPQAIAVLAYPLLLVGMAGLTTRRESAWSVAPPTAIASAAVGTAVTALAFTLPYLLREKLPLAESDWVGLLALGDFVIALMAVRRVLGAPHRNWSRWLLVAGFVAWGNAHAEVGARIHDGAYGGGSRIGLTLVVGPLLVGLAGLLPSMADVPAPRPHGERQAEATNWAWLVALPPALIVVVHAAEVNASRLWIVLPLALLATWAVGRMEALIGRLDDPDGGLGDARHEALESVHRPRSETIRVMSVGRSCHDVHLSLGRSGVASGSQAVFDRPPSGIGASAELRHAGRGTGAFAYAGRGQGSSGPGAPEAGGLVPPDPDAQLTLGT